MGTIVGLQDGDQEAGVRFLSAWYNSFLHCTNEKEEMHFYTPWISFGFPVMRKNCFLRCAA